ncbi:MAG: hypothetical protein QOD62_1397, partial [Actinomycetota bacterium]|nr:hypothetical protein [Actinomycetota bacterium]
MCSARTRRPPFSQASKETPVVGPLLSSVRMSTVDAIAKLEALRAEALEATEAAPDAAALRDTEIRYLGRKGPLAAVLSTLGGME